MNNISLSIRELYNNVHQNKKDISIKDEKDYKSIKNNYQILKKITNEFDNIIKNYEQINNITSNDKTYGLDKNYSYCYICKTKISEFNQHDFYTKMCFTCGTINKLKRDVIKDLTGKIAIVTGGRVKIGFETSLRLLRCNCYVIITTRFAKDAIIRYTKEVDYENWINNLKIYEINFLNLDETKNFIKFIFDNYKKIDYLINNAAQTISRPKDFYNHLLLAEPNVKLVKECIVNKNSMEISNGAVILAPQNTHLFPLEKYDRFGQQIDLRDNNSWMLELDDINLEEFLEVQAINNITPFILVQKLIPILQKQNSEFSWIINVTSMEGIFNYNNKNTHHVHTNIAKAGLNMMTRTSGKYLYEKYNIVMCAVETGWNNPQQPLSYDFDTPIDCLDGAMRILDPIFSNLTKHSVVYKDYQIHNW
jgi:NAD(P)-dependent dehydrogenase (short-subunit alcohol dehydrogenase family)